MDNQPDSDKNSRQAARQASNQAALALELPFVLVGAVAVGALLGYYLDRWWHTKPIFLTLLAGMGFAGGIREILRRLPGDTSGSGPS
jgi:ATP synthase protein I